MLRRAEEQRRRIEV